MDKIAVIILAAGLGKRLGGDLPKVLAEVWGKSLISYVLDSVAHLSPAEIVIVTGHKRELVESEVQKHHLAKSVKFAFQEKQCGTGDAARVGFKALNDFKGNVVILYGDMPLVTSSTLQKIVKAVDEQKATLGLVTTFNERLADFGRIVRDAKGEIQKIVERRDASPLEVAIREVNPGIYAADSAFLRHALDALTNENSQKEYYLTDIVARAVKEGQRICNVIASDLDEFIGVNTRADLTEARAALNRRNIQRHIENGVVFLNAASALVWPSVKIGAGSVIGQNVQIEGDTVIGENVRIDGVAHILDSEIKAGAHLLIGTRLERAVVGEEAHVGPFAHLRPGTVLGREVKIGNFVEVKKSRLGDGSKASHLTYLGDATIGSDVNIGAGTITCNYDGYVKSETHLEDGVFIGSNTSLVAPVKIGKGAVIGAGSVITKDIEADALALTRAELKQCSGWAKKKRERAEKGKS
jgi:bifunctional UDP-N-acetylglucosamine pyrophosphorylase/glucosamine-1-phosphate N-acetyltransferase